MVLTEYDEEKLYDCILEQGREEGILRGRDEERARMIKKMLERGLSKAEILFYDFTEEEIAEAERVRKKAE